jgi:hypothetical protein
MGDYCIEHHLNVQTGRWRLLWSESWGAMQAYGRNMLSLSFVSQKVQNNFALARPGKFASPLLVLKLKDI